MPKSKNKNINLLPQKEFEASILGRVLRWATTTFRYIVIITEMIVMGAFLSRFWLDAKNSDLNDLIEVRSAQITSQSDFEKQFRNVQKKLDIVAEMSKDLKSSEILSKISALVPPDVTLSSVSLLNGSTQVKGAAGGEIVIAQFIANLASNDFFKEVSLGAASQSENDPSLTIFTVNLKY